MKYHEHILTSGCFLYRLYSEMDALCDSHSESRAPKTGTMHQELTDIPTRNWQVYN